MPSSPLIVILILSWNSIPDTLTCLQAASQSDYPSFKLLVVDNANQPALAAALANTSCDVTLIQNPANLGYAGGNNAGIRWALDQGADYVLLLNDDMLIEPATCQNLVTAAQRDPACAAVGGKIHPLGEPHLLWAAGEAFPREAPCVLDAPPYDQPRQLRYAVGGCALLSRAALKVVGLFDEAFFLLHEEKEWCARALRAGFHIRYTPQAVAWHNLHSSFTSQRAPAYHYLYVRNNLLFHQRQGSLRPGWGGLSQAMQFWWYEAVFIRRCGSQRLRSAWAAGRGALDYLRSSFGPPPAGL